MAVRWSSENVVAEHRDLQATAMALDWRGDYTLLAGRRNLALISLDKPLEIVKRVNRTQQKYDVTAAEWNPKQALGHTFVIASGEKAEICQWTEGSLNGMTTLRAHTRTITDINWHRFDPHLLVTCSIDTFVHIWDTRETRKPIASLSAIAGASQVKWNKLNPHILASGHDCDVRVWDHRKPGQPMQYIAAHLSKIQGLDWSPNHENHLVTSSNDCTVKFFDILNPRKAENFINTLSPVWRARYTPFGEGVVAVVVPQLRRGENSLRLWSVTDMSSPVHTFVGHSDVVLEFEWRQNLSNPGDYQLVTWARDHSLRIWKIDHQLQKLCGHEMEEEVMLTERTDSDYTSDTTPTPGPEPNDVDGDGERRDLVLTNSDTHQTEADNSAIDGCEPDRSINSNKFNLNGTNKNTQEAARGTPQKSEIVLAETVSPEASQTLVSVATPSPSHQVSNFTSTLPAANKASTSVVGLSSTLPAGSSLTVGQPMTLQQEFSLLNTSLDNNQVNSVEVVNEVEEAESREIKISQEGREIDGLDKEEEISSGRDCSGLVEEPCHLSGDYVILKKEDSELVECGREEEVDSIMRGAERMTQDPGGLVEGDNLKGANLVEQVSYVKEGETSVNDATSGQNCIDLENSSALVHTVVDFVKELDSDDDERQFTACDLNSLTAEENKQSEHEEMEDAENRESLFEFRSVEVMHEGQEVSAASDGDLKSLTVSYLLELENGKREPLVASNRGYPNNHIIKIKSYTDDLGEATDKESHKYSMGEEPALRIRFSSESEMTTLEHVVKQSERMRVSPQNLEGWLVDNSDMISLVPITEAASLKEVDMGKEEAVIHIVECEGGLEANEIPAPSTLLTGEDVASTGASTLGEAEVVSEQVMDTSPLMLSLPLVTAQTTMSAAVMEGSILIKGSKNESLQVSAKLVYLPDCEENNLGPPEEACASLAPQLLEGGVLVLGDNIIMLSNQLYLTHVELVAAEGDTHTQISISLPTDPVENYHEKKVNFVLISLGSEQNLVMASAPCTPQKLVRLLQDDRISVRNAPHSDEPGIFQCDKCDKSYKVRSSLNSHKVTHNSEKMYKCDECDKAFHYSTPLQIHKRIHTDERPYKCDRCSASFRSKANLKYHERLHTGERPITCRECGQGFKDYTSLKRHRQKAHEISSLKCGECSEVCLSLEHLTTHMWQVHDVLYVEESASKCEKCGETFTDKRTYNNHIIMHERRDKAAQVGLRKLADYTHRCGICNMTCQNKTQMLLHIQIHAAVKRFKCRYCSSAFMYRFLLARHVREQHPDDPEWFCQYCDDIFETCRKMTMHSCRTVRGDYSCPHCPFKTEVRHRLFRHIVKTHPEDKMPYYCEFCKNSFEDPNKLRYHQKREHPEKMLVVSLQRESAKTNGGGVGGGGKDKSDSPSIDMSQVEMTIEGDTLVYFIPEDLRNDEVFREKVKFKCFYCEAKFPIKNSMTRHILREHPGEKAYKCLKCNIFLKSSVESKNHHRRYHRFSETGGRDPNRNERAMMKRAQWLQTQLNSTESRIKNLYKFSCRFCQMVYREKRSLVAHYRKRHPDEEWDYFPDKPIRSVAKTGRKKRILVYYDCSFHDDCNAVFDDLSMLRQHLFNAHDIAEEYSDKYVSKRLVIDHLRRGRLPKNAIDRQAQRVQIGKRKLEVRQDSIIPSTDMDTDNEEIVDDPVGVDDGLDSKVDIINSLHESLTPELSVEDSEETSSGLDRKRARSSSSSWCEQKQQIHLDDIGSLHDVKKMLYRCHRCNRSFTSRGEYREHVARARHVDCRTIRYDPPIKQEPVDDDSFSGTDTVDCYESSVDEQRLKYEGDEGKEQQRRTVSHRGRKRLQHTQLRREDTIKLEMESQDEEESIAITSLEMEEQGEALLKVLTIHAPETGCSGFVGVKVEDEGKGKNKGPIDRDTDESCSGKGKSLPAQAALPFNKKDFLCHSENVLDSLSLMNSSRSSQVMSRSFVAVSSEGGSSSDNITTLGEFNTASTVRIKTRKVERTQLEVKKVKEPRNVEENLERRGARAGRRPGRKGKNQEKRGRNSEKNNIESRRSNGVKREREMSDGKVCELCHANFKTRAEASFHMRLDH
ncbi:uncharacterized protein LOC125041625 isoform X1 [Penaeus chinensis]|uniref:uncharacterized protein LOC125041625 isoform X1 n=1 Tax=Penaeus chinensis TaxID=139456 RepID=UPI001FB5AC77|nr:uncharacterized protein LOC125041625 isoform X1 [Penaeus chinensis]